MIFGDSLTDTGNAYLGSGMTTPPSPPYYEGRFSNGPVFVERLAEGLGLPAPTASLEGGTNFALGGATTAQSGLSFMETPNMGTQIGLYAASGATPAPDQLFVLYGGANDFLNEGQTNPTAVVDNLASEIMTLAGLGAKNFLVPNLPALGSLPATLGSPVADGLNALTIAYNGLLAARLDQLQGSLGVRIHQMNVYRLVQDALAHPAAYGFSNVTTPAFDAGTGKVADNLDTYLFWDTVHPTARGHEYLGRLAIASVPEPSSIPLVALGGAGLAVAARRRRAA